MAKYVLVDKAPSKLDKDCIVIGRPNFMQEIKQCIKKKPRAGTMTVNYLREIVATIGLKYASETFNPLTDVNVALYKGVPCETDEKTHEIVVKAFSKCYPEIFDQFVEYYIKRRPRGTKLVYFLGSHSQSAKFDQHGIDSIPPKEVDVYLGKKTKRIIGKPAITKEQAEQKQDTV